MKKEPRIALINITEFSKDGLGRGRWQASEESSYPVDVPFSMPGDEVEVSLLKKKIGLYQCRPLNLVHLSDQRVEPRCIHFGLCGGCKWQHIPYEMQLKLKEESIQKLLEPYLRSGAEWHSIIPCTPPWNYRNKMELTFSRDKYGKRYLGLIEYGTRGHVFQMEECHLMPQWGIDAVKAAAKWWEESGLDAYYGGRDIGSLRTLILRSGERSGDRMVMLTVSGNPDFALHRNQINSFTESMRAAIESSLPDQKLSIFLRIQQIAKGQKTQFFEMLLHGPDHIREILEIDTGDQKPISLDFKISPSAFFQPNSQQAEKLYSRAIQLTQAPKGGVVLDLYCGTGTLGICMAKQAKEIIGIELSPESSLDARENVKRNGLENVIIYTGDVGHILPKIMEERKLMPAAVLVDPPRAGLDARAMKHLLDLKSPIITYVSCNPYTQSENIAAFVEEGYAIKAVQPVDQFPQTAHVENIVVLTK